MTSTHDQLHANLIEAANRSEATALLIRAWYRVFEPEADVSGVDLIVGRPTGELMQCQLKARPTVHWPRYGGRNIWMLFPTPRGIPLKRTWFLVKHDELFEFAKAKMVKERNFYARSFSTLTKELEIYLQPYSIPFPEKPDSSKTERLVNDADI